MQSTACVSVPTAVSQGLGGAREMCVEGLSCTPCQEAGPGFRAGGRGRGRPSVLTE